MAFNLDDYEPVASRVQRFYEAFPDGAIHSEIVYDDGNRVVIKATVYRHITDAMPAAVDYAEEHLTDRGVNATSRVENAVTSAIGRAISVAAFGLGPSDWTKKPTREEMSKVQRMTSGTDKRMPEVKVTQPANTLTEAQERAIRAICKANGRTVPSNLQSMSKQDASALIDALKKGEEPSATEAPEEPF